MRMTLQRTGLVFALLALLSGACGDSGANSGTDAGRDAGAADARMTLPPASDARPADAGTQDDSGGDEDARRTLDAGLTDAGRGDGAPADAAPPPPSCAEGEMPCGEDCIRAIPSTLAWIHARIFSGSCAVSTECHASPGAQGLDLLTPASVLTFVGKASTQRPELSIIEADKPEKSYLIHKLRGRSIASLSARMPRPPNAPLCDAKIDVIEAWIAAGAKND